MAEFMLGGASQSVDNLARGHSVPCTESHFCVDCLKGRGVVAPTCRPYKLIALGWATEILKFDHEIGIVRTRNLNGNCFARNIRPSIESSHADGNERLALNRRIALKVDAQRKVIPPMHSVLLARAGIGRPNIVWKVRVKGAAQWAIQASASIVASRSVAACASTRHCQQEGQAPGQEIAPLRGICFHVLSSFDDRPSTSGQSSRVSGSVVRVA